MKKFSIVAALLLSTAPAAAQSAGTTTLFGGTTGSGRSQDATGDGGREIPADNRDQVTENGWYLAPTLGATYVNSGVSPTYGLRGAWRINEKFGLGLAATGFEFEDDALDRDLELGYGGLMFEYVLNSDELAHAVFSTTIGGGAWCTREGGRDEKCDDGRGFFAAEPTFSMEVNLNSFMRAGVGGGYRVAVTEKYRGISSSDLSGFTGHVSLEFGQF